MEFLKKLAEFDSLNEQKRQWVLEGFFKSIGWLPVAILWGLLMFFGFREYISYRLTQALDRAPAPIELPPIRLPQTP
jgi:hypothetical protein